MKNLVRLELKKICNKTTVIISVLLFALIVIQYLNMVVPTLKAINPDGSISTGLKAYRVIKDHEAPYEGYVTPEFIEKLKEHGKNCADVTYPSGKTIFAHFQLNAFLNFPYSVLNNAIPTFEWSEENTDQFYSQWKGHVASYLHYKGNDYGYTKTEAKKLAEKMNQVETPVLYQYCEGWNSLKVNLYHTLPLFLLVLAFLLANSFAKNTTEGIDQISLSTKEGRRRLLRSKILSAHIVTAAMYFLYCVILLLLTGIIYTFHGWDASGIFGAYNFYSLNMLESALICLALGYFASIIIMYFILFLSIIAKRGPVVVGLAAAYLLLSNKYRQSPYEPYMTIATFLPQDFVQSPVNIEQMYFVGSHIVPYGVLALALGLGYFAVLRLGIQLAMKRYYLQ